MSHKYLVGAVAILILLIGGYAAYQYVKYKPPAFLIDLVTATKPPPPLPEGELAPLQVPEGLTATIFARDVKGARVMARDPGGVMLVSETSEGKVVALPDRDEDGQADETITVLEGLRQPHGLAFICGDVCTLYVAETGELKSYSYDADTYKATAPKTLATFPTGSGHYTRTLLPHPDGQHLLISVGSSCNACDESDSKRATIQSLNLATGELSTFATGLRNTVFMSIHPVTGEVWGTDNGRDLLGEDVPPDEVNILKEGQNYGWPICYGQNLHDTDFDRKQYVHDPCADKTPARIDLPAHSAALGLDFVPEEGWPEEYWHDLIIAYHGSWNRSEPTGYKVVRYDFIDDDVLQDQFSTDFMTGFLPEKESDTDNAIGRPVDVMIESGGVMYVSDDRAGAIYRVTLNEMPR